MKKSNYNFTLNPSTAGEFIKRFNRLLNVTSCLSAETVFYTKGLDKILPNSKSYINIKKSYPFYLIQGKMSYDTYPAQILGYINLSYNDFNQSEGIIIRINLDSCICFYWGQKFKFTPVQIKTVGTAKVENYRKKTNRKSTTTFSIFHDVEKANKRNETDDYYSKMYYEDCLSGWDNELLD